MAAAACLFIEEVRRGSGRAVRLCVRYSAHCHERSATTLSWTFIVASTCRHRIDVTDLLIADAVAELARVQVNLATARKARTYSRAVTAQPDRLRAAGERLRAAACVGHRPTAIMAAVDSSAVSALQAASASAPSTASPRMSLTFLCSTHRPRARPFIGSSASPRVRFLAAVSTVGGMLLPPALAQLVADGKDNKLPYPVFMSRLQQAGVQRYTVRLSDNRSVYHTADGAEYEEEQTAAESQPAQVSARWDEQAVHAAIERRGPLKQTSFDEFRREMAAAGVSEYEAMVDSRQVVYRGQQPAHSFTQQVPVMPMQ